MNTGLPCTFAHRLFTTLMATTQRRSTWTLAERRRRLERPLSPKNSSLRSLFDDCAPAATGEVAGARPARPEDEREQGADDADDEQDVADGMNVEAARRDVDGPG